MGSWNWERQGRKTQIQSVIFLSVMTSFQSHFQEVDIICENKIIKHSLK